MRQKPVKKRGPQANRRPQRPSRRPQRPVSRPRRPAARPEKPSAHPAVGLREFELHLLEVADALPWFGEEPFKASRRRRPPRPVFSSLSYVRRVLLAFLAGRPMSDVAARAGCGVRTIYKVIGGVIYQLPEYDEIPIWLDLGLFGVVEPRPEQPPPPDISVGFLQEPVQGDDVLLFCLICHGFMGGMDNSGLFWRPNPDFGGELLEPSVISDRGVTDKLQGHLVAHFRLQDERIAMPPPLDLEARYRARWARAAEEWDDPDLIRLNRINNWSRSWSLGEAAGRILDRRSPLGGAGYLPSIAGRQMSLERARDHWLSFIPDAGT